MGCGCNKRLRKTLKLEGYRYIHGKWIKEDDVIPDDKIDEHHTRITAMRPEIWKTAAKVTAMESVIKLSDLLPSINPTDT